MNEYITGVEYVIELKEGYIRCLGGVPFECTDIIHCTAFPHRSDAAKVIDEYSISDATIKTRIAAFRLED